MKLIADQTGLPLALYELGSSAGLNLIPDQYQYDFAGVIMGRHDSPVILSPTWEGELPPNIEPVLSSRHGCDQAPIRIIDPFDKERLLSYIWPDQPERLNRAEAAIELFLHKNPKISKSDAGDWVERMMNAPAVTGEVRVLYHSIVYQYFPENLKQRISICMDQAGKNATPETPVAWLAFEQFEDQGPRLTLKLWPGGDEHVLAHGDAHVRKVRWLGAV